MRITGINKKRLIWILSIAGAAVAGVSFFNRNPKRTIPSNVNPLKDILSPADGVIQSINTINNTTKIEIFIRLNDVHLQRIPYDGKIKSIENIDNYKDTILLDTRVGEIIIERSGGILARSLRTTVIEGQTVKQGDIYGKILLGSHAWITVPYVAKITVKVGDHLKAGISVVATV